MSPAARFVFGNFERPNRSEDQDGYGTVLVDITLYRSLGGPQRSHRTTAMSPLSLTQTHHN